MIKNKNLEFFLVILLVVGFGFRLGIRHEIGTQFYFVLSCFQIASPPAQATLTQSSIFLPSTRQATVIGAHIWVTSGTTLCPHDWFVSSKSSPHRSQYRSLVFALVSGKFVSTPSPSSSVFSGILLATTFAHMNCRISLSDSKGRTSCCYFYWDDVRSEDWFREMTSWSHF